MWWWWKDRNATPDVSTSPRCWPTHVTSFPTQNEATRFRFLTPTTRRVFLQVSCGESFWAIWTAGPTGRGRRAVLRGSRGVAPVTMDAIASLFTSLTIVYSTVYSDADQRKRQSSVSLAFVWGIHRGSVNSPHKWPVTRKMFPFDDVIKV